MKKQKSAKSDEINYITPQGYERMQTELHDLLTKERPAVTKVITWAAGNGDRSENADYIYGKRRLREIDRRIKFLHDRLEICQVVKLPSPPLETIQFFATVTIQDEEARTKKYTIVGADEVDLKKNHISWKSPLATALLGKRRGDEIEFKNPKGELVQWEILQVEYIDL